MLSWLAGHPKVKRFAVLDDQCDGLDGLPLFQPSGKAGLTLEIERGLERYLKGQTDQDMRRSVAVRLVQNVHALFNRDKS